MKLDNKNVILFWLNRHRRELEQQAEAATDTEMAKAGLSYQARQVAIVEAARKADGMKVQLASVIAAIRFIEENAE